MTDILGAIGNAGIAAGGVETLGEVTTAVDASAAIQPGLDVPDDILAGALTSVTVEAVISGLLILMTIIAGIIWGWRTVMETLSSSFQHPALPEKPKPVKSNLKPAPPIQIYLNDEQEKVLQDIIDALKKARIIGLLELSKKLSKQAGGRDVNFMIYDSIVTAAKGTSMNQGFTIVSSDEITVNDIHNLIQEARGTLTPEQFDEGYLEYKHIYVWVSMGKISHKTEDEIEEETQLLGLPPRSFISLEASTKDVSLSYQLVYDFSSLCMQKFHCILDTHMDAEDDEDDGPLITADIVQQIAEQRVFSHLVPPPPGITQQNQEA